MKEILKLVITLTVICGVAGALLGFVNAKTKGPIQAAKDAKFTEAIGKVLPANCEAPQGITVLNPVSNSSNTFYVAKADDGSLAGIAIETSSENGYSGHISLMIGINSSNTLQGISILEQNETPGLGAKITTDDFKNGLTGKNIETTTWKVKKDGGDVDAITAATISSRAVSEAVQAAITQFTQCRELLTAK